MIDLAVKRFLSLFWDMYICFNSNCISACKPQDFVTNFGELTAVSFLLVRLPRHPSAEGFLAMEGDWIPDQVGKDKRGFIEPHGDSSLRSERDKVYPATSQNSG
jgi:hypothetical protein